MKRLLGLLLIVRRSLRQHALGTAVTCASVALASGLAMSVFAVQAQTHAAFTGGESGFDAVLGARGSALQLVLNAVYHLETSPGNVPWSAYTELRDDPRVELALPYAVGDNYRGCRIVGTTKELFTRFEYRRGRRFAVAAGGRPFDESRREAVVGSLAARRAGLSVGSRFEPAHGLEHDGHRHAEEYVVVGILEPTNSPSDRVIWIPIEGVFRMGGHRLRGAGEDFEAKPGEAIPDEHREVSAVMLKLRNREAGFALDRSINKQGTAATLAWPLGAVMSDLFDKLGWVNRVLELVAYLVVAVAAGSILASLYNCMNERRREFAILRALGAKRRTIFSAVVLEAASIALAGGALGWLVYGLILAGAAAVVRAQTGVHLELFAFHPALAVVPGAMTVLGAAAGTVPAAKAYATDVVSHLVPTS